MKIAVRILSAAVAAATALSASAIPSLAAATTTKTNGVTVTYTRDYAAGTGTYSWDFSGVTTTDTVGTGSDGVTGSETANQYYTVGGGLSVHNLQLHYLSDNTTYYDVYGKQWVPEPGDNNEVKYATKYVKFEPTVSGDFSFTIYDASGDKWRAYYTTDGTLPSKSATQVDVTSSSPTATIEMTADKTYIIALYSYNKASAMSDIKYTVTDNTAPYAATVTTADSKDTAAWSFSDCSALSAITSFDTDETTVIDSQLSLGKGDTVSAAGGITFAGTGFNDTDKSDTDTVGENGRYMLLAPKADGTLTVTHNLSRLYLLELNATSISDFNTNKLDAFNSMTKAAATSDTYPTDVLKSKASTTMGSDKNTSYDTITGTAALTAGNVYALIYYNWNNTSGYGISAMSYKAESTHAQTFSFTKNISEFSDSAKVYVTVGEKTSNGIDLFDDSFTKLTGDADAVLAITIKNIPNDTTVTSVTVK